MKCLQKIGKRSLRRISLGRKRWSWAKIWPSITSSKVSIKAITFDHIFDEVICDEVIHFRRSDQIWLSTKCHSMFQPALKRLRDQLCVMSYWSKLCEQNLLNNCWPKLCVSDGVGIFFLRMEWLCTFQREKKKKKEFCPKKAFKSYFFKYFVFNVLSFVFNVLSLSFKWC
jgi:hypothetical protein